MRSHLSQAIPISTTSASRKTNISSGQVSGRFCWPLWLSFEQQQFIAARITHSPGTCTASHYFAFVAVIGLGLLSAAVTRAERDAHPANMQAVQTEVEAISRDFESGLARSSCNLHKRLYTFVEEYGQTKLYRGSYSGLQSQGLPRERVEFFLDPWNSAYWIRDRCDRQSDTRILFVYSFGPNRRRDSSRTEILGDDIGSHFSSK